MECEHVDDAGRKCRQPAGWRVRVGSRRTDEQYACARHLNQTCAAMYSAENRASAELIVGSVR